MPGSDCEDSNKVELAEPREKIELLLIMQEIHYYIWKKKKTSIVIFCLFYFFVLLQIIVPTLSYESETGSVINFFDYLCFVLYLSKGGAGSNIVSMMLVLGILFVMILCLVSAFIFLSPMERIVSTTKAMFYVFFCLLPLVLTQITNIFIRYCEFVDVSQPSLVSFLSITCPFLMFSLLIFLNFISCHSCLFIVHPFAMFSPRIGFLTLPFVFVILILNSLPCAKSPILATVNVIISLVRLLCGFRRPVYPKRIYQVIFMSVLASNIAVNILRATPIDSLIRIYISVGVTFTIFVLFFIYYFVTLSGFYLESKDIFDKYFSDRLEGAVKLIKNYLDKDTTPERSDKANLRNAIKLIMTERNMVLTREEENKLMKWSDTLFTNSLADFFFLWTSKTYLKRKSNVVNTMIEEKEKRTQTLEETFWYDTMIEEIEKRTQTLEKTFWYKAWIGDFECLPQLSREMGRTKYYLRNLYKYFSERYQLNKINSNYNKDLVHDNTLRTLIMLLEVYGFLTLIAFTAFHVLSTCFLMNIAKSPLSYSHLLDSVHYMQSMMLEIAANQTVSNSTLNNLSSSIEEALDSNNPMLRALLESHSTFRDEIALLPGNYTNYTNADFFRLEKDIGCTLEESMYAFLNTSDVPKYMNDIFFIAVPAFPILLAVLVFFSICCLDRKSRRLFSKFKTVKKEKYEKRSTKQNTKIKVSPPSEASNSFLNNMYFVMEYFSSAAIGSVIIFLLFVLEYYLIYNDIEEFALEINESTNLFLMHIPLVQSIFCSDSACISECAVISDAAVFDHVRLTMSEQKLSRIPRMHYEILGSILYNKYQASAVDLVTLVGKFRESIVDIVDIWNESSLFFISRLIVHVLCGLMLFFLLFYHRNIVRPSLHYEYTNGSELYASLSSENDLEHIHVDLDVDYSLVDVRLFVYSTKIKKITLETIKYSERRDVDLSNLTNRDDKKRDDKNKDDKNKDDQNKDDQNRDDQNRDDQERDDKNRDDKNRDDQNRDDQKRDIIERRNKKVYCKCYDYDRVLYMEFDDPCDDRDKIRHEYEDIKKIFTKSYLDQSYIQLTDNKPKKILIIVIKFDDFMVGIENKGRDFIINYRTGIANAIREKLKFVYLMREEGNKFFCFALIEDEELNKRRREVKSVLDSIFLDANHKIYIYPPIDPKEEKEPLKKSDSKFSMIDLNEDFLLKYKPEII